MDRKINFEWYVVNSGMSGDIEHYNIFNNIQVYEGTLELCKQYKEENLTFEAFTEELRKLIMWQEWGRCEYEVCVANWPPTYRNKEGKRISVYGGQEHEPIESVDMKKIDCYWQALPNMKIIAKYVLEEYYPELNIRLNNGNL